MKSRTVFTTILCINLIIERSLPIKVSIFNVSIQEENTSPKQIFDFSNILRDDSRQSTIQVLKSPTSHLIHLNDKKVESNDRLDRELLCQLRLCSCKPDCIIEQRLVVENTMIVVLRIHIVDINDNYPTFSHTYNALYVSSDTPLGSKIPIEPATDGDSPPFSVCSYELASKTNEYEINFTRERQELDLVIVRPLGSRKVSRVILKVFECGLYRRSTSAEYTIIVLPSIMYRDKIQTHWLNMSVKENQRDVLQLPEAHDVKYMIIDVNMEAMFIIGNEGYLRLRRNFDFEFKSQYVLVIAAIKKKIIDHVLIIFQEISTYINVEDENESPYLYLNSRLAFENNTVYVGEVENTIGDLCIRDEDRKDDFELNCTSNGVKIHSIQGRCHSLTLNRLNVLNKLWFRCRATDKRGASDERFIQIDRNNLGPKRPRFSHRLFNLSISSDMKSIGVINPDNVSIVLEFEHRPLIKTRMFTQMTTAVKKRFEDMGSHSRLEYAFTISEDHKFTVPIGSLKMHKHSADSLTLKGRNCPFILSPTGDILLFPDHELDRERQSKYTCEVKVVDSESVIGHVKITVSDINDNYPIFVKPDAETFRVRAEFGQTIICSIVVFDPDSGPNGLVDVRIDSNSFGVFQLNASVLQLRHFLVESGVYDVVLIACDNGQKRLCSKKTLKVFIDSSYDQNFETKQTSALIPLPIVTAVLLLMAILTSGVLVYFLTFGSFERCNIRRFSIKRSRPLVCCCNPSNKTQATNDLSVSENLKIRIPEQFTDVSANYL
ncbi:hypothetical protein ACOME3_009335 [Neoechinorhynchus agilis]